MAPAVIGSIPRKEAVVLAVLAVDLLLLSLVRSAEVQTPWVLWCVLLVAPLALIELARRWQARTLGTVLAPALLLVWVAAADLLAAFPVTSLAQSGLLVHALLLAIVAARPWSAAGRVLLLLLVALPALGYGVWAGWTEFASAGGAGVIRDPNNTAVSAVLGTIVLLGLVRLLVLPIWPGVVLCAATGLLVAGFLDAITVSAVLLLAATLRAATERDRGAVLWFAAALLGVVLGSFLPQGESASPPASAAAPGSPPVQAEGPAGTPSEASRSAPTLGDLVDRALAHRAPLYAASVDLLGAAPIHGHGLQSFHVLFERYRQPGYRDLASMVHGDYLQLGLELGWPALLGLLALVGLLVRRWGLVSLATLRGDEEPEGRCVGWLSLGVLAVFGHALVNFPLYDGFVLAQVAVLAVLCLRGGERMQAGSAQLVSRGAALLGATAAMLVAARLVVLAVAMVVFLRHPLLPGVASGAQPPSRTLAFAASLEGVGFVGGMASFATGSQLASAWASGGRQDAALASAAERAFRDAADAEPWVGEYAVQAARMARETGAPLAEREALLDRALGWQPRDARLFLSLAVHRLRDGDLDGAVAAASRRWLPWCRHAPRARRRENGDLLGLAALDPARRAEWQACASWLVQRGVVVSEPEEVLARFGYVTDES